MQNLKKRIYDFKGIVWQTISYLGGEDIRFVLILLSNTWEKNERIT